MPDLTDKAAVFTEAILADARARSREIRESVESAEKTALDRLEAEQKAEAERRVAAGTADARARAEKRITAGVLKCRRELLQYREDCAGEVYEAVRARLVSYPDSADYGGTLCALLGKALGVLPGGGRVTVYLRARDMGYAQRLQKELPNAELDFAEGSFALGGLIAESAESALRADMTFDSALEDLSGRFSELTGFDVEERHGN